MSSTDFYVLNEERAPVAAPVDEWARWFETEDRTVAKTGDGDILISTVFLGLDHNFGLIGAPVLFETLVFGGVLDGEMDRYTTWEEAEAGHAHMVERVMAAESAKPETP